MQYGLVPTLICLYIQSLSSADKQLQLSRSAHQGQLANLQPAVDPPNVVHHPVDQGQAMAGRKTEDKMSRKPLTDAEKIDIINRVRGEDGQGMPYRQISKESGYPISTISRVVKGWREKNSVNGEHHSNISYECQWKECLDNGQCSS